MMGARARSIAVPERGTVLLEKYEVEGVVGFGGMGVVLSAHHRQLARRVAIKLLTPPHSKRPETRKRFRAEARAVSLLTSEYICRVLDAGELDDEIKTPFMVMEFLDGNHLGEWLRSRDAEHPPPTELVVELVLQACVGIAEAHSKGIVHRDIKPANLVIMDRADGAGGSLAGAPFLKVIDFGVSKNLAPASDDESAAPTRTHAYLGSPLYSSPEQLISARAATPLSDQWSLGVVLYQCLTQSVPFDAPAGAAVWRVAEAIEKDEPIPLSTKRRSSCPPIDRDLERAVMRTLEKAPERRFASIGELAFALAPFGGPRAKELLRQISAYDNMSANRSRELRSSPKRKGPSVEPWTQDVAPLPGDESEANHHASTSATLAMATLSTASSPSAAPQKASSEAGNATERGGEGGGGATSWSRKRQLLAFVVGAAATAGVLVVSARAAKTPTMTPTEQPTPAASSPNSSSPSPSPPSHSSPPITSNTSSLASSTSSASSAASTSPAHASSSATHASRPPPPSVRATPAPRFLKTRSGE